jgi:hypothetical protein
MEVNPYQGPHFIENIHSHVVAITAPVDPWVTINAAQPHLQSVTDNSQVIVSRLAVQIVVRLCYAMEHIEKGDTGMVYQGVCLLLDCYKSLPASAHGKNTSITYSETSDRLQGVLPYYQ